MTRRALGAGVIGGILLVAITACASTPTPSPSLSAPVLATETFTDPAGDVAGADLIGIRTVATDEVVVIELEFASVEDRAEASGGIVIGEPPAQGMANCDGYVGPYSIAWGPEASPEAATLLATEPGEFVAQLEAAANGPWMSVTVPLALIGDPPALYFSAIIGPSEGVAEGERVDLSPNTRGMCHTASLGS